MPPPSWGSPRSAMETADESLEPTEDRRTRPGMGASDDDRDGKFMPPGGRLSRVVYVRRIWGLIRGRGRGRGRDTGEGLVEVVKVVEVGDGISAVAARLTWACQAERR